MTPRAACNCYVGQLAAVVWLCCIAAQECCVTADYKSRSSGSPERLARYECSGIGTAKELDDQYSWWLANLEEVRTLRSRKSREGQKITIVEPLSIERLTPLRLQCAIWSGVIAVAVYLPLVGDTLLSPDDNSSIHSGMTLDKAIKHLQEEHQKMEGRCTLDMAIFVERLPEGREHDLFLGFPNNALRNAALEMADTEVVMLLDGDFLPGPISYLDQLHHDPKVYSELRSLMDNKAYVVLQSLMIPGSRTTPFEQTMQLAMDSVHANKSQLVEMVEKGLVWEFGPMFHVESNFTHWLYTNEMYGTEYRTTEGGLPGNYEPYILALKDELPFYDERFRGYFYNKAFYFYQLYRLDFNIVVHPEAFVIHFPHMAMHETATGYDTPSFYKKTWLYKEKIPSEYTDPVEGYRPVRAQQPCRCTHIKQVDSSVQVSL